MKVPKCIALALMGAMLQACHTRGGGDNAEGPYTEEADLLSICSQRPPESCETADELCRVLEALPIDVEQRCSRPREQVACVPAPAPGARADIGPAECRTDAQGNTWAIANADAPPDWRPLAAHAPAEWQQGCESIPRCED